MKDMGDTSYVIRIEILCNRLQRLLGLSRKTYIDKILEWFWMKKHALSVCFQFKKTTNLVKCNI